MEPVYPNIQENIYIEKEPAVRIVCSVVIPVHNEEESLPKFWAELKQVMQGLSQGFEIIFVNDASLDRSGEILREFRRQNPDLISIIDLPQRGGQTHALQKGLAATRGQWVVTMDGDLQNDPADIPALLIKLEEGYDVVCGWRKSRKDKPFKTFFSKCGNILQRFLTGLSIHDVSCTLRVYKGECALGVPLNWEGQHRFIPLSLALSGYRVGEIVVHHRQRQFGVTKYNHKRIFKVILDFFRVVYSRGR